MGVDESENGAHREGLIGSTCLGIAIRCSLAPLGCLGHHELVAGGPVTGSTAATRRLGRPPGRQGAELLAVARDVFLELGAVLAPDVIRMRRLVAAESDRFPETAATYLADSWTSNIKALADAITDLAARGELHIADPWLAAHQFTWTAIGAPLNAQTIGGSSALTPPNDLSRFAADAANVLIADPTTAADDGSSSQ